MKAAGCNTGLAPGTTCGRRDRARPLVTLPVPSEAGWSPMEAAEALLGDKVARVWKAGARSSDLLALAVDLLRLIRDRPDLTLEGRDFAALPNAPRVRIPRDVFGTATFAILDIRDETVRFLPPGRKSWMMLHAVAVVRVMPAPPVRFVRMPTSTAAAETRCRRWIAELATAHPDQPPSPKLALMATAVERFGVTKRAFTRAWDTNAPGSWRVAGRKKSNQRTN